MSAYSVDTYLHLYRMVLIALHSCWASTLASRVVNAFWSSPLSSTLGYVIKTRCGILAHVINTVLDVVIRHKQFVVRQANITKEKVAAKAHAVRLKGCAFREYSESYTFQGDVIQDAIILERYQNAIRYYDLQCESRLKQAKHQQLELDSQRRRQYCWTAFLCIVALTTACVPHAKAWLRYYHLLSATKQMFAVLRFVVCVILYLVNAILSFFRRLYALMPIIMALMSWQICREFAHSAKLHSELETTEAMLSETNLNLTFIQSRCDLETLTMTNALVAMRTQQQFLQNDFTKCSVDRYNTYTAFETLKHNHSALSSERVSLKEQLDFLRGKYDLETRTVMNELVLTRTQQRFLQNDYMKCSVDRYNTHTALETLKQDHSALSSEFEAVKEQLDVLRGKYDALKETIKPDAWNELDTMYQNGSISWIEYQARRVLLHGRDATREGVKNFLTGGILGFAVRPLAQRVAFYASTTVAPVIMSISGAFGGAFVQMPALEHAQ